MKINNKGFTLIEVLAVLIILSIIFAIMVPNVSRVINENKENSLESIKNSIRSSARMYVSDNKYDINVEGICPDEINESNRRMSVSGDNLVDDKIRVSTLIEMGYLKRTNKGIVNPVTGSSLDENNTFVSVYYDCIKKDLFVDLEELVWNSVD